MKPLTIDEVKALEFGDWVWVEDALEKKYWQIFSNEGGHLIVLASDCITDTFLYSDYGKTWTAYKNKEQAETKGELLELPCKVGDTVYYIANHYGDNGLEFDEVRETKFRIGDFDNIGYFVFLTKEAAEARLKELQEQKK